MVTIVLHDKPAIGLVVQWVLSILMEQVLHGTIGLLCSMICLGRFFCQYHRFAWT